MASGRYSATAEARRRRRRWPVATRTRTGDAVAPPTDGDGDGGGRGVTAADGAVLLDSGRGGTAVGGAGSVVAAAVRTAPASPDRCRPAIRSTRCPCDWRPAGHRPRSIPCPSLYNRDLLGLGSFGHPRCCCPRLRPYFWVPKSSCSPSSTAFGH